MFFPFSYIALALNKASLNAGVVQLVRTPPCHGGGRGFKSRLSRHFPKVQPGHMGNILLVRHR